MDASAALEQRLRDRPGDTEAWLAYGDLLRARGDARGSLIRLERRRALARPADRPPLEREIAALVAEHREEWDAALPEGVTVVERRHGFATKIAVEWSDDAPVLIERARRAPFVTALRIEPGELPRHYEDDEDDAPPPTVETGALATLDLRGLVELDLSYLPIGPLGAETLAVAGLLRSEATAAGARAAASETGRVRTLDLRYARIGDAGLAAVAASPTFRGVRRLHLQRNDLTAEGVPALHRFEGITELDLRYNDIGADGVRALLAAPFVGSLRRLYLNRPDVGGDGAALLARAAALPPALRSLWRNA